MLSACVLALQLTAAPPPALAPGARYDARIPTIEQILGHDHGEKITTPEEIPIYLRALNQAAPESETADQPPFLELCEFSGPLR